MICVVPYEEGNVTDTAWHFSPWLAKPIAQQVLRMDLRIKAHEADTCLALRVEGTNNPANTTGAAIPRGAGAPFCVMEPQTELRYVAKDTVLHRLTTPDFPVAGYAFVRIAYRFESATNPNALGMDVALRDEPPLVPTSVAVSQSDYGPDIRKERNDDRLSI